MNPQQTKKPSSTGAHRASLASASTLIDDAAQVALMRAAYERCEPEMLALPTSSVLTHGIDVFGVLAAVAAGVPRIEAMHVELAALPGLDLARVRALDDYRLAAAWSHQTYLASTRPPPPLSPIYVEGLALRDTLLADLRTLARRGLVDAAVVKRIANRAGYRNVAAGLLASAGVLRGAWDTVSARCAAQQHEVDRAVVLADQIMATVGERALGPARVSAAFDLRQRAFTLLLQVYEEARRGVGYLLAGRSEVTEVAPSPYAYRAAPVKAKPPVTAPEPSASAPAPQTTPPPSEAVAAA